MWRVLAGLRVFVNPLLQIVWCIDLKKTKMYKTIFSKTLLLKYMEKRSMITFAGLTLLLFVNNLFFPVETEYRIYHGSKCYSEQQGQAFQIHSRC